MPNYNPSTIARIGEIHSGLKVQTAVLAATSYLIQAQVELFNVIGRIKIIDLYGEVYVAISNTATTLKFNATWTTPTIAVADLTAASGSMAQKARGVRVYSVGGAVATAAVLTSGPGISDINVTPQIVGMEGGVGTIGQVTAGANATSGSMQFFLHYVPMSDGAYASAIL
jgi:hypothetical protein